MNRQECIKKINKLIPDEKVRNSIFMGDELEEDFLTSSATILTYFSNILSLAFMFVYSRYKKWKRLDNKYDESSMSNNFLRVFDELEQIYNDASLTFDIIENLLVDIQLDISMNGLITSELQLNKFINPNNNFSRYAYIAKKARRTSRLNEQTNILTRYDELIDLIKIFPFLRDLEYEFETIEQVYQLTESGKRSTTKLQKVTFIYEDEDDNTEAVDTSLMYVYYNGSYYLLERTEQFVEFEDTEEKNILTFSYWRLGSFIQIMLYIYISSSDNEIDDYHMDSLYIQFDGAYEYYGYTMNCEFAKNAESEKEEFRIRNFYNINYKYIKNLALSISDVLREDAKRIIVSLYGSKHHFERAKSGVVLLDGNQKLPYSWSEIISVLMIEEGATNILANLLANDHDIIGRLLDNLEFRFGRDLFSKEEVEQSIRTAKENFRNQYYNKTIHNIQEKADSQVQYKHIAEIEAAKIIVAISKAVNGNNIKEYRVCFPISIRSKKRLLEEIKASNFDLEVKYSLVCQLVSETIKTLHEFYYGFFKYSVHKKEFDNESFYRSLNSQEIENYQDSANRAFKKGVKEVVNIYKDIQNTETGKIIEKFKDFCFSVEFNTHNNNYQQYLKDYLGKTKIIDIPVLEKLENCFVVEPTEDTFDDIVEIIQKVFQYLKDSKFERLDTKLGVIFPYVATCEYTDITRDGNEIYHFSILSAKGREKTLRVLSEFSYNLSEKYYFLPNKLSSDERLNLWIEPVIISYNNFDLEEEDD